MMVVMQRFEWACHGFRTRPRWARRTGMLRPRSKPERTKNSVEINVFDTRKMV